MRPRVFDDQFVQIFDETENNDDYGAREANENSGGYIRETIWMTESE